MAPSGKERATSDSHDDIDDIHDLNDDGSEDEQDDGPDEGSSTAGASSSQKKKKKKKKSKAAKLLDSLRGKEVPQSIVDTVMEKVKERDPTFNADESDVRLALEQLKITEVAQGKVGLFGTGKKDLGNHKFWSTQPVPQPDEGPPELDGYIEPSVPPNEVRQDAYPLPKDFEWSVVDLSDQDQLKEVYDLLSANYVEDDDASLRFRYSAEFLEWALMPPGYYKEWHVGVRVRSNKKLVGFISGVPIGMRVRENAFMASEINYLCVHKKLRSKRLAPVLIKEVTRQCHLKGVFQAIYTAGVVIPTPVATCRYYHRTINDRKLVDVGFTFIPRHMTMARMQRMSKLENTPVLLNSGLREMRDGDIHHVAELFTRYMRRFTLTPILTIEEMRHQFLSGLGTGPAPKDFQGRRERQVVWAYVIEDPGTKRITDFFTFYSLPSTIVKSVNGDVIEAAYLFYYATDVAFQDGADADGRLKKRLEELIGDALIIAGQAKFDVFNALSLMDNVLFAKDLKFKDGNGFLNYYLYNWRTSPVAGYNQVGDVPAGRGVGVVML